MIFSLNVFKPQVHVLYFGIQLSSEICFKWKHARNVRPPERIIKWKEGKNEGKKEIGREREGRKGWRERVKKGEKREKRKKISAQIVKFSLSPGLAPAHNQLNKEVISV